MIPLTTLAALFASLSLLAFGGGATILPEMQRALVSHHWIDAPSFAALYGLAQAAPGPNLMVATLLGWHLAGVSGALVCTAAMFLPSSLLTIAAIRLWDRPGTSHWRARLRRGIFPVTAGLITASAGVMARTAASTPLLTATIAVVAVLSCTTRLHPLWLLAASAAAGALS